MQKVITRIVDARTILDFEKEVSDLIAGDQWRLTKVDAVPHPWDGRGSVDPLLKTLVPPCAVMTAILEDNKTMRDAMAKIAEQIKNTPQSPPRPLPPVPGHPGAVNLPHIVRNPVPPPAPAPVPMPKTA